MLSQEKIDRINELANKKKTKGLTKKEEQEQKKLREEYLSSFRNSFKNQLHSMKVVDPEGQDVTPEKLKDEQEKNKKH
ncbi:DUF896 domain-containing protein [Alkalibacillus haloalkaliphilus]|uniref:UPF0291 protein AHA02nite_07840 n=1 Tax=Alkalibacillus haloalkaliphilus TaxID=94136 RepID=A0A511W3T5_9BACI|nr:DUF896 domain-containing protein [Alkalibacillus haloalkaliphilus]MDV2580690.1 DUF896 domain-containing protein [Alkalibacillus haloalkaliphilus]GEN45008.1 UPF0291 protein YnzC [Alkalibacillus haloalkaliphilus]